MIAAAEMIAATVSAVAINDGVDPLEAIISTIYVPDAWLRARMFAAARGARLWPR